MKPVLDTVVMSNAVHGYLSQSDKGELVIGAGIDHYNSYTQRGSPHVIEHTAAAIIELFPMFSRVRLNRQWGGIVDTTPDACPLQRAALQPPHPTAPTVAATRSPRRPPPLRAHKNPDAPPPPPLRGGWLVEAQGGGGAAVKGWSAAARGGKSKLRRRTWSRLGL